MRKQKQIAADLGVSDQAVSNWLSGKTGISRRNAFRLTEVFGRDPGFWMFSDLDEIKSVLFFTCPLNVGGGEGDSEINNQRACR